MEVSPPGSPMSVGTRPCGSGIAVSRGSGVASRDLVALGDTVGFDSSQSFTQALTGLPQELERVGGRALRGSPIQVSAVLLDQVRLKRRGDFVGRLQRVIDGPVPCGVVNPIHIFAAASRRHGYVQRTGTGLVMSGRGCDPCLCASGRGDAVACCPLARAVLPATPPAAGRSPAPPPTSSNDLSRTAPNWADLGAVLRYESRLMTHSESAGICFRASAERDGVAHTA